MIIINTKNKYGQIPYEIEKIIEYERENEIENEYYEEREEKEFDCYYYYEEEECIDSNEKEYYDEGDAEYECSNDDEMMNPF